MYLLIYTPFNPLISSCFLVVFSFAQRVLIHSHISASVCTCTYVWCLYAWMHARICRYVCMCVCLKLDFAKERKYLSSKSGLLWVTWWSLIPFIFLQMTWIHSPLWPKNTILQVFLPRFLHSVIEDYSHFLAIENAAVPLAIHVCWLLWHVQEWRGGIYSCWILVVFFFFF